MEGLTYEMQLAVVSQAHLLLLRVTEYMAEQEEHGIVGDDEALVKVSDDTYDLLLKVNKEWVRKDAYQDMEEKGEDK
jgi:hypothetical protein